MARNIIYSSQLRRKDVTRKELGHRIRSGGKLKITVRQSSRGILPDFKQERKEQIRKRGGRREHCCYVVDLTETTVKSITTLIMAKISNIHWIEICL